MSAIAIASSLFSQFASLAAQNKSQQIKQGFQQLSQDLQAGNLSQSQSDFSSLRQILPTSQSNSAAASTTAAQSTNPLATAVSQLAQDLKSGNLSAAQSDLPTVQQDVQQIGRQHGSGQAHHHHHHRDAHGDSSQDSGSPGPISTLFNQLGQSLQSGNLAAAQQAYSSLQQDFQQFSLNASVNSASNSATSNLSVSA
jgi:hypothetical protein